MNGATRSAKAQLISMGSSPAPDECGIHPLGCGVAVPRRPDVGIAEFVLSTIKRSRIGSTPSLGARRVSTERKPLAAAFVQAECVGSPPTAGLSSMQSTTGLDLHGAFNWLGAAARPTWFAPAQSNAAIAKISFIFFTEVGQRYRGAIFDWQYNRWQSFQPLAAQSDLDRFIQCLIFTPTLVNDTQDHHRCANPMPRWHS